VVSIFSLIMTLTCFRFTQTTPSGKDPSGKDPSGKDPSGKDPSGKDPSGKDPASFVRETC